jgi:RND superfamily putative drug exporter
VSGLTLIIACVGLLIIPMDAVGALGVGCATAVASVLISNLTFVPAVLLTFPTFFGNVAKPAAAAVDRVALIGDDESGGVPAAVINSGSTPKPRRSRIRCCVTWRGFAEWIVRPPVAAVTVLLVCAVTAPFGYPALTYSTSQSVEMALPRGADVTEAFLTMSQEFGYGYLNAYTLLVALPADSNGTVLSGAYYDASRAAVDALVAALPNTTQSMFAGVSTAGGMTIQHTYTEQCLDPNSLFYKLSYCVALRYQFAQDVNANRSASLFTVAIDSFDPNAELGFDWYRAFLAAAPAIARNTSLELALTGGPAPGWDSVQMAYDDFPLMIGIVSGTILLVVGIALKSVLIPLRSLLAVALTLGFCYGSASLVYEWGVLDWMGFMGLHTMSPHDRALLWMPPLVSFGIIVGLCLDYDLFLLIRVADFRKSGAGMPNRDAVVLGLSSTGPIITAAGVIMAVAFCGLLFSSTMAMNQLAFFMVSAVLYDTFVVRTLLVPALMSLMGDAVWWPGLKQTARQYI